MTEINLLDIKHGDTVTAKFVDATKGTYEITGEVRVENPSYFGGIRRVGGERLLHATSILAHIPGPPAWLDAIAIRDGHGAVWGNDGDDGWVCLGNWGVGQRLTNEQARKMFEARGDVTILLDKDGKGRTT